MGRSLEPLTEDHRVGGTNQSAYLSRALGIGRNVEIDYGQHPIAAGDVFILTTDGVHDCVDGAAMADAIAAHAPDLDAAAQAIASLALQRGSADNSTIQIVRVDTLPDSDLSEHLLSPPELPLPPLLAEQDEIDGLRVIRQLHGNARSRVYLMRDTTDQRLLVLKVPVSEGPTDPAYLRQFLMEEWIARRLDNPHVLRSVLRDRRASALYLLTDYIEGQTLTQWMRDHPRPSLLQVRGIVGQVAKGLTAFHRQSMVHQDLRPDNVLVDADGHVTIIDFGATRVAGVSELESGGTPRDWPGTLQYTAPECLLSAAGSVQSDLFSLGVITYQLLTGRLPYGDAAARVSSDKEAKRLRFEPIDPALNLPAWLEGAVARAVAIDPHRRYAEASEFVYDLSHPNTDLAPPTGAARPMSEQLRFWKTNSLVLFCATAVLLLLLLVR